jgi:hypothetical protein
VCDFVLNTERTSDLPAVSLCRCGADTSVFRLCLSENGFGDSLLTVRGLHVLSAILGDAACKLEREQRDAKTPLLTQARARNTEEAHP